MANGAAVTIALRAVIIVVTAWWLMPPPVQYDRPIKMRMRYESTAQLMARCGGWACAYPWMRPCTVFLPNDQDRSTVANLLRHERAHCAGWPNNHPR